MEGPGKHLAEKELDYDDDTMELILPSGGHRVCVTAYFPCTSHTYLQYLQYRPLLCLPLGMGLCPHLPLFSLPSSSATSAVMDLWTGALGSFAHCISSLSCDSHGILQQEFPYLFGCNLERQ